VVALCQYVSVIVVVGSAASLYYFSTSWAEKKFVVTPCAMPRLHFPESLAMAMVALPRGIVGCANQLWHYQWSIQNNIRFTSCGMAIDDKNQNHNNQQHQCPFLSLHLNYSYDKSER